MINLAEHALPNHLDEQLSSKDQHSVRGSATRGYLHYRSSLSRLSGLQRRNTVNLSDSSPELSARRRGFRSDKLNFQIYEQVRVELQPKTHDEDPETLDLIEKLRVA